MDSLLHNYLSIQFINYISVFFSLCWCIIWRLCTYQIMQRVSGKVWPHKKCISWHVYNWYVVNLVILCYFHYFITIVAETNFDSLYCSMMFTFHSMWILIQIIIILIQSILHNSLSWSGKVIQNIIQYLKVISHITF